MLRLDAFALVKHGIELHAWHGACWVVLPTPHYIEGGLIVIGEDGRLKLASVVQFEPSALLEQFAADAWRAVFRRYPDLMEEFERKGRL
jgi:hypothetical protein